MAARRTARDVPYRNADLRSINYGAAHLQAFKALLSRRVRTLMYRVCFCSGEVQSAFVALSIGSLFISIFAIFAWTFKYIITVTINWETIVGI